MSNSRIIQIIRGSSLKVGWLLGPLLLITILSATNATTEAFSPNAFTCADINEIPPIECNALQAIDNSTDIGWFTSTTPCTDWWRITCSDPGSPYRHVTKINWDEDGIAGTIPPEIGNLSYLEFIDFDDNRLTGAIPAEMGNLNRLTSLNLGFNELTGNIPAELGNLTSLTSLSLRRNQLNGSIPSELGNLGNLDWLSIYSNQLTGTIPAELGSLANLTGLQLDINQLSGSIPSELGNLANLSVIDLGNNQLTGSIPIELGNLTNLNDLSLHDNQLSGSIPANLGNLSNLWSLDLQNNYLSGQIPANFGNLNISSLRLNGNALSGEFPSSIVQLVNLNYATDFGYNKLTTSNPSVIAFLNVKDPDWAQTQTIAPSDLQTEVKSTSEIQLSWTPINYAVDGGYYQISYGKSSSAAEKTIQTADKTVSGHTINGLDAGTKYYFKVRTYTPAHGAQQNDLWSEYGAITSATTDPGVVACSSVSDIPYSECQALKAFYDGLTDRGDIEATWFKSNTACNWLGITCNGGNVTELILWRFNLSGRIAPELQELTQLKVLALGQNRYWYGGIPPELGNLSNLEVLDLHENSLLDGPIPPELGNLSNLRILDLEMNELSGRVPNELGNLSRLDELYLDWNPLSGGLPQSLTNLSLSTFWFNDTDLCEPNNNAFQNWLSSISYLDRTSVTCTVPDPTSLNIVVSSIAGKVRLLWDAPSDIDGGKVLEYDIRYSNEPITEDSFGSMNQVLAISYPGEPGTKEKTDVTVVIGKRTYFALRSKGDGGWSSISNVPSVIDGGFRPYQDGYQFKNSEVTSNLNSNDFTEDDMIRMFGEEAVCINGGESICDAKLTAKIWRKSVNFRMKYGLCEGMAVTSLRLFADIDSPVNDDIPNTYNLGQGDIISGTTNYGGLPDPDKYVTTTRRHIAYYHAFQYSKSLDEEQNQAFKQNTPNDVLILLLNALSGNRTALPILMMNTRNLFGVGHSITPFAVTDDGTGIFLIHVYDNIFPYQINEVTINQNNNSWKYEDSTDYSGDEKSHNLAMMSIAEYAQRPTGFLFLGKSASETNIQNEGHGQVWFLGDGHLLISNALGQQIGYLGDQFVNEIPGAYEVVNRGGLGLALEPSYTLPLGGDYTINISGDTLTSPSDISVTQFGPGYAVQVDSSLIPNAQDQLVIASDGVSLKYEPTSEAEPTLTLALDTQDESYEFQVRDADIGAEESVGLEVEMESGELILNNSQAGNSTYTLGIRQLSSSGENVYLHNNVSIEANDTQRIDFGNWDGAGEISVCTDSGSNGSVDKCENLENEASDNSRLFLPTIMR